MEIHPPHALRSWKDFLVQLLTITAGILIALQRPYALFFLLLVLIPVQIVRARKEAKVLEAKFGEEYRACRAKTWF